MKFNKKQNIEYEFSKQFWKIVNGGNPRTVKNENTIKEAYFIIKKAYMSNKIDAYLSWVHLDQQYYDDIYGRINDREKFPHFYKGSNGGNNRCEECGKSPEEGNHVRNTNIICDNPDGPCACGAWHHKEGK